MLDTDFEFYVAFLKSFSVIPTWAVCVQENGNLVRVE